MIKGIISMFVGAILTAAIIVGLIWLLFSGFLLLIFGVMIIAAAILFIAIFIFALIVFFAFFYYIVEKKPTNSPGNYKLEMEKGKNE